MKLTKRQLKTLIEMALGRVRYAQEKDDDYEFTDQMPDAFKGTDVESALSDVEVVRDFFKDSVVDVDISGNSNQFDIDWGYNASSERLDFDLDINTGSSNVWDINIDADDVTWNVDVIGSSNNFATTQSDGAYQSLTMEWVGSNGDIDIIQSSGTCPTGISSCYGVINADFDSENAIVDIKQKDTGD